MLNVNAITNRLAMMSDPQLQQYATINKSDPYMVSLAIAESNRRKQLRNAQQMQAAGQEPPKVVDQDIANMGIAAVAPDSVGEFTAAGGGIVAFAGGDVVPGMDYGQDQRMLREARRRTPSPAALTPDQPVGIGFDPAATYFRNLEMLNKRPMPYEAEFKEALEDRAAAGREKQAGLEELLTKHADLYKGPRERLIKRGEDIEGLKQKAIDMAWMQAGAAMMGGPNLGAGLAAAAKAGTESYSKGMDKYQEAKDKHDEAMGKIELLQAQQSEMSDRERFKLKSEIRSDLSASKVALVEAHMKDYNVNRGTAEMMTKEQGDIAQTIAARKQAKDTDMRALMDAEIAYKTNPTQANKIRYEAALTAAQTVRGGEYKKGALNLNIEKAIQKDMDSWLSNYQDADLKLYRKLSREGVSDANKAAQARDIYKRKEQEIRANYARVGSDAEDSVTPRASSRGEIRNFGDLPK